MTYKELKQIERDNRLINLGQITITLSLVLITVLAAMGV